MLPLAIIVSDLTTSARYVDETIGRSDLLVVAAPDTPTVRALMVDRFSLRRFPLYIKLDRARRVVAAGADFQRVLAAG